jgi:putative hydrolase of HD superfamily
MITKRLEQQMAFIMEVEKLKAIYRQNMVYDESRHENSAEHSWHLALMAVILSDEAIEPGVDLSRVIEMLLIHDIVEIDAGDTFLYDTEGHLDKEERETRAAERIFGLLPPDQGQRLMALWKEFDERSTASARFAAAIDNMQPVINHYVSNGCGIVGHALKTAQSWKRRRFIGEISPSHGNTPRKTVEKGRGGVLLPRRNER